VVFRGIQMHKTPIEGGLRTAGSRFNVRSATYAGAILSGSHPQSNPCVPYRQSRGKVCRSETGPVAQKPLSRALFDHFIPRLSGIRRVPGEDPEGKVVKVWLKVLYGSMQVLRTDDLLAREGSLFRWPGSPGSLCRTGANESQEVRRHEPRETSQRVLCPAA
jgi:hypothetical protein